MKKVMKNWRYWLMVVIGFIAFFQSDWDATQ